MDFEVFYERYERTVAQNPTSTFLIHFRIATHGTIDEYNCHPFQINKTQAFIHNGIIPNMPNDGKLDLRSDTRIFKDNVLRKLPQGWETNPAIKVLIESAIGMSKLCVLNIDNTFQIYKEASGHWKDDVWYSNKSYEYQQPIVHASYNRNYWLNKKKGNESFREQKIFGLSTRDRLDPTPLECEWCNDPLPRHKAYKVDVGGTPVICCGDCCQLLMKDELFTASLPSLT
jgi:hypothetical protein